MTNPTQNSGMDYKNKQGTSTTDATRKQEKTPGKDDKKSGSSTGSNYGSSQGNR